VGITRAILSQYKDPDEYVYYNTNDRDLIPFRVKLPVIKDIEQVTNYGLVASEQVFKYEIYPMRLLSLEEDIYKDLRQKTKLSAQQKTLEFSRMMWDSLYGNYEKYHKEIEWIKTQWHYRLHGKWYFINGKPTYIDGMHWFYLNYWHLEQVGTPTYRERDRKWFLAQRYFMTTTEAPKKAGRGEYMYHPDGTLVMEDVGFRTFLGSNDLKARQIGDTSKAACILYEIISRTPEGRGGIQAEDEKQSEFVFHRKLKLPVSLMKFIFRPTLKEIVSISSGTSLDFSSQEKGFGLNASIDYATTVSKSFYDGENLNVILVDEAGKLSSRESVKARHEVVRKCMRVLEGFMMYCTTVYELDTSAGDEYLKLTKQSHFHERNDDKKTTSELGNIFFPADEAYEGFIGKFGEPIKDTPVLPEQIPYIKRKIRNDKGEIMGARDFLLSVRRKYEKAGDMEGLANEKRMEPLSFRDCFTPPAKAQWFDYNVISNRLAEIQINPLPHVLRGNLIWVGNKFSNKVTFRDDPSGRWFISKRLTHNEANRIIKRRGTYFPDNGFKYLCTSDVFRAVKTEGGKMSDGGMTVFMPWDKTIDPSDKNVDLWETRRFVCTYLFRPSVSEFVEDVLKTCIYYGAFQYPENNLASVEEKFREWGYSGYLLFGRDPKTGKPNNAAGWYTNEKTKPEMFNRGRDWIARHGAMCEHEELLKQFNEIRNPGELHSFDLLASALGAFLGEEVILETSDFKEKVKTFELNELYPKYYY
jgi:hypothetical protein